jgi:hypothetical protein
MPGTIITFKSQSSARECQRPDAPVHLGPSGCEKPIRVVVAAFSSPEIERFGREIGVSIAVIAPSMNPGRLASKLSRQWHASWAPRENWFQAVDYYLSDQASSTFRQTPLDPRWMGNASLLAPVCFADGGLAVEIPGDALSDYTKLFASAMAERAVERFAAKPGCIRRRFATGRPLTIAPRYTCNPACAPVGVNLTLVQNLYAFRPKDLPVLASAVHSAATVVELRWSLNLLAGATGSRDE